jgi:hypothetical protein
MNQRLSRLRRQNVDADRLGYAVGKESPSAARVVELPPAPPAEH